MMGIVSTFLTVMLLLLLFRFTPALHQFVLDTELIADAGYDEVDEVRDGFWFMIKTWHRGEDDAGLLKS